MSLQSHETKDLLDIVDSLRSHGISRYIDLPEIIVCGEQSSGKSSVLEAVSGVKFPSKDNLCTRFATELILRRGADTTVRVSIIPSARENNRSESDLDKLHKFSYSVSAEDLQLEAVIEAAKDAMGISDEGGKAFSSDTLRLELSGPTQPHLTLVDLPGLFQAGSRSQSDADAKTVEALVLSYMKNPRSIILAVVSAKNDFNNQSITRYSREIDPNGNRTLGLITKPDTLYEGSDSERFYLELARNQQVEFRLGWHVLRNRDFTSKDTTTAERDRVEDLFFKTGLWGSLSVDQTGVRTLKPRLSKILKDHIVAQLPDVLAQIKDGIQECTSRLEGLGASRATAQEQRRYLLQVSQSFTTLVRAAIDGQYSDPFFGDASTTEGYQKRLRAVLQNTLTHFAADMRKKGHTFTILDEGRAESPQQISRADYISRVTKLLDRSRGRELPGTFDPLIIGQLFHEQRRPWSGLVEEHLHVLLRAVSILTRKALERVCDETTLAGVSRRFILPRMEHLTAEVRAKVIELLEPYEIGHPITYNHYLTENVQKAQRERRAKEMKKSLEGFFGGDFTGSAPHYVQVDVNALIATLVSKTEADMNSYASSTATDFMQAYYKVAQKTMIDDFSILAVEARLIRKLPSLFSPADVIDMDDTSVSALASENEESSRERTRCSEKLRVLEDGLKALQNYSDVSPLRLDDNEAFLRNDINGEHEHRKPDAADAQMTYRGTEPHVEEILSTDSLTATRGQSDSSALSPTIKKKKAKKAILWPDE